jgi:hypothetical protein
MSANDDQFEKTVNAHGSCAPSAGSADRLTPTQIANWKRAFPEMAFFTDEQVQRLRDNIQGRLDRESPPNAALNDKTMPNRTPDTK